MATNSAVGQGAILTDAGHLSIQNQTFNNFAQRDQERQYSLREQLWFDDIKHRERVIDNAHEGTCTWLLQCHQYRLWTTEPRTDWRHGLLWIKGNPAAGKSTIMKFAVDSARSQDSGELILPHFFNARGSKLEKSTEGMYRTLLVWLLDNLSIEVCEELRRKFATNKIDQAWPIPELLRILKSAVEKISPDKSAVFYIDALDECDQNEVRDMLRAFRGIMRRAWEAGKRVRICFASRPHPDMNFKDAIFLDLSEQPEHIEDISRFISDELDIGDSILAEEVRTRVREKARGSFMWTRLVVHALNKEYDSGALGKLRQRLDEIPSDLHALYHYTLESYPQDRLEMLICFQWLHFTRIPLAAPELWWAIQRGLGRDTVVIRDEFALHSAVTMERYIVNITKGLAELRDHSCQFIHQSVADFLVTPAGLQYLFGLEEYAQFAGQSYDLLKWCCEADIRAFGPSLQQQAAETGLALRFFGNLQCDAIGRTPFLKHAAQEMMSYADHAHLCGADQYNFLAALRSRIGPSFIFAREKSYGNLSLVHNVYCLLRECRCASMLSDIGSAPAHRVKELARSCGFRLQSTDIVDWLAWCQGRDLIIGLGLELSNNIAALTNLLLHQRDRGSELQLLLSELRIALVRQDPRPAKSYVQNRLLAMAHRRPAFGTFLLLVRATPETLEPHVESLRRCVATADPSYLTFLKTMLFFIKNQLTSDVVDFSQPDVIQNISFSRSVGGPEVEQISNQIIWLCTIGLAT